MGQSATPQVNLYVANHGKLGGIEDYIEILRERLAASRMELLVSRSLVPGMINILIDEFTNSYQNSKVEQFKKENPDTILIYVLTEFLEKKYFITSMNHFGTIMDSALITLANILIKRKRNDMYPLDMHDWLFFILYTPLICYSFSKRLLFILFSLFFRMSILKRYIRIKKRYYYRLVYLHIRYIGLKRYIKHATHILTSHELIAPSLEKAGWLEKQDERFIGVLHPEFDEAEINKNLSQFSEKKRLGMEMTGSVSVYRRRWAKKINLEILMQGFNSVMGIIETKDFSQRFRSDKRRTAFSLHPPQTKHWPYSSPLRLFRALQVDGNIPVLTHYFGQNPIEEVCLRYSGPETLFQMCELYEDEEHLKTHMLPRVAAYNQVAKAKNEIWVDRIKDLVQKQAKMNEAKETSR